MDENEFDYGSAMESSLKSSLSLFAAKVGQEMAECVALAEKGGGKLNEEILEEYEMFIEKFEAVEALITGDKLAEAESKLPEIEIQAEALVMLLRREKKLLIHGQKPRPKTPGKPS